MTGAHRAAMPLRLRSTPPLDRKLTPILVLSTIVLAVFSGLALIGVGAQRTGPKAAALPASTFHVDPSRVTPEAASNMALVLRPGHVYVPSLGVAAAWVPEPVKAGSLSIPADVHTVGLSDAGGQPDSQAGTVMLASHVNWVGQGEGVFSTLYRVKAGALVVLTDAAGRVSRWVVTGLDDPVKRALDPGLFTAVGPRRLVLITCGGAVHDGEYARNIVVTAVPATSVVGGRS